MADRGGWSAADETAFAGFYVSLFPRVCRTARLIVRDQAAAEDVAQEAFTQLYVRWRRVSRYDNPAAWVRRVAIRQATRMAARDRMRETLSRRAFREPTAPGPRDIDLERAVAALTPRQRAVVALFYFEDLSVNEIAAAMDQSTSAVKVTLHRARHVLAGMLSEGAGDD